MAVRAIEERSNPKMLYHENVCPGAETGSGDCKRSEDHKLFILFPSLTWSSLQKLVYIACLHITWQCS